MQNEIQLDSLDFVISNQYLQRIEGFGVEILYTSKWLNKVVVRLNATQIDSISKLHFIQEINSLDASDIRQTFDLETLENQEVAPRVSAALCANSVAMLRDRLLERGFRGQGKCVAVFDDGFRNVDVLPAFEYLFTENRIIATKDFILPYSNVFRYGGHGTQVFSVLAARLPGGAPPPLRDVAFCLARTEDNNSESILEEYAWVAAAEWADSIGADVFQTSLGYNVFTSGPFAGYTHADLDGRTAPISRAARIAARKGILVINSAGNEGNSPWRKLLVPADADSILAVGAVDYMGQRASFSSIGPGADGRIKPDVVAPGVGVPVLNSSGNWVTTNGTSFSAPNLTVLATALWSAVPQANAQEIVEAIRMGASQAYLPDSLVGYGIPNALQSLWWLRWATSRNLSDYKTGIRLLPNPTLGPITLLLPDDWEFSNFKLDIIDLMGRSVYQEFLSKDRQLSSFQIPAFRINANLSPGNYLLRVFRGVSDEVAYYERFNVWASE